MPTTDNSSDNETGPPRPPWMQVPPASGTHSFHARPEQPGKNTQGTMGIQAKGGPPKEYIITPKPDAGAAGLSLLNNFLHQAGPFPPFADPGMEILRTRPRRLLNGVALAADGAGTTGAILVRMDSNKGDILSRQAELPTSPFWIEENHKLNLQPEMPCHYYSTINWADFSDGDHRMPISLQVIGDGGMPLKNTTIKLTIGRLNYLAARTDDGGNARIDIPVAAMSLIDKILLEPETMHWPRLIHEPLFKPGARMVMRVYSFTDLYGHGTHVCGVIGAKGTIDHFPQRGMAPGAEIHIYKVFPGNDTFTLGYAIEAAIGDGMDVINMSLCLPPSHDIAKKNVRRTGCGHRLCRRSGQ